ncbi:MULTISPECIES: 50S ribosomal protein L13 [Candidatus Ichthyocystis]|uniref:Large ribosomal subunit protein uL13 n=1 Tax=Candidatus Ichthyocystis hellenicum TaxID=1561003 RepID=A0A0S4M0W9_9BURK|nr:MULTISPECIES: 50S ribosomal protein L13 [Ichthyocystis]CUT17431.1 50S ribosomal protein L13 [Candidatus Ichthyocystis hellenicum]
MKTCSAKLSEIKRRWILIDASGKVLGRLASDCAGILRGKNRVEYTPHIDTGDFLVIVNASKIILTGNKMSQKKYYRHSGYPGGLYERTFSEMVDKDASKVIFLAIRGMLPKGPLGRDMLRKCKIYNGCDHPHAAQQPQPL